MDVVLLIVTTLSLAAAAGFGDPVLADRPRVRSATVATATDGAVLSDRRMDRRLRQGLDGPLLSTNSAAAGPRVAVGSVFDRGDEGLRGRPLIRVAVGAS